MAAMIRGRPQHRRTGESRLDSSKDGVSIVVFLFPAAESTAAETQSEPSEDSRRDQGHCAHDACSLCQPLVVARSSPGRRQVVVKSSLKGRHFVSFAVGPWWICRGHPISAPPLSIMTPVRRPALRSALHALRFDYTALLSSLFLAPLRPAAVPTLPSPHPPPPSPQVPPNRGRVPCRATWLCTTRGLSMVLSLSLSLIARTGFLPYRTDVETGGMNDGRQRQ